MKTEIFDVSNIPAVLYGEPCDSCFIFVHGQGGNKFEAERFAYIASKFGYQVLATDLPKHGTRNDDVDFVPWEARKELMKVIDYAKRKWRKISVRATSIGVYFSLLAFKSEKIEKCLIVSPLVDMRRTIADLMKVANVDEEKLRAEKEIKTDFGQTLSWRYYLFAQENSVKAIGKRTEILYANGDEVIPRETVEKFANENNCNLTVLNDCEHWLHLPSEIELLERWETSVLKNE